MNYVYYPCIVVGSGMAGLTSGNYLRLSGIPCLVLEGKQPGGALMQSNDVRNWPGEQSITGKQLMLRTRTQAAHNGVELFDSTATHVDLSRFGHLFRVRTADIHPVHQTESFLTQTIIIATGSVPRRLGLPNEDLYFGKGVYTCAICEGSMVKGKVVAVVGGGDTAIAQCLYLIPLVQTVHLLVRGERFRARDASRIAQLQAETEKSNGKVIIHMETKVTALEGNHQRLSAIQIETRGRNQTLAVEALFLAIGITPNTQLFPTLRKTTDGTLHVSRNQETSHRGVFAAGDVCDSLYRQALNAASDGCKCAIQVKKFLDEYPLRMFPVGRAPFLVHTQPLRVPIILPVHKPQKPVEHSGIENESCHLESCGPKNIYEQKDKSEYKTHKRDTETNTETKDDIQEIMSFADWKAFAKKHPNILLEIMSGNCMACGSIEFTIRELPTRYPKIRFARVDMELVDPKDLKQMGDALGIPERIELPYFGNVVKGKLVASLQGPEHASKKHLCAFLQQSCKAR
jgi:thioredoxin reductase (NADPH)